MNDEEKRAKLHEILDLVLDVNGFEERCAETTGNAPTVFMEFSGHICAVDVNICSDGWRKCKDYDFKGQAFLSDNPILSKGCEYDLDTIIKKLENVHGLL